MSRDRDQGRAPSPWSNYQHNAGPTPLGISTDLNVGRPTQPSLQGSNPLSAPPTTPSRLPDRPNLPTRSSTVGSSDPDRNLSPNSTAFPKARSDDLNHSSSSSNYHQNPYNPSSPRPSPPFLASGLASSRPNTPSASNQSKSPSSSGHSDHSNNLSSLNSHSEPHSDPSTSNSVSQKPAPSNTSTSTSLSST